MASLHDKGEGVWIRGAFTDPVSGAPADPTVVRVRYRAPSDPTVTTKVYPGDPVVVKDSVGHYSLLLTAAEPGLWEYRWEGENVAPAITEGSFIVRRTDLA